MADDIALRGRVKEAIRQLMAQREEVLKAFIAKFGFGPEYAIQIEEVNDDGTHRWYVRKMTEEEQERAGVKPCS